MSCHCFIAICNPLHYMSALTSTRILGTGLAAAVRGFGVLSPLAFLLRRLPFCCAKALSHPYCLHPDIMKLACADFSLHILYGLCAGILVFGIGSLLIVISYVMIWTTIISTTSQSPVHLHLPCLCCLHHTLVWGGPSSSCSAVQYLPLCASCSQLSHLRYEQ